MHFLPEYSKGDHFLSGIDGRMKILVALALLIMVLSYKGFLLPLLISLLSIVLCIKMKIPLHAFFVRFSEPLLIILTVLLLKFLFSGRDVLFSFHLLGMKIAGHRDGLIEGSMIASRILGAVSIVATVGFCMSFTELIAGLSWLRVPKGLIEILMFAYRFLFVLLEDAGIIYHSQKNRLGYSNIRRALGSFGILAGSLILKAFDHADHITTTMIQRGYDGDIPVLKQKPFRVSEVIISILVITAMGFVWKMQ